MDTATKVTRDDRVPNPSSPRPPAKTVGRIEVPTAAPVKISAAPLVTIGNTTEKVFSGKNLWRNTFTSTAVIFTF